MAPDQPPAEPTSLQEWLWYVKRYEKGIFVRHRGGDGNWTNVALADLDPKAWADRVALWLENGHIPVRVKEPQEMEE